MNLPMKILFTILICLVLFINKANAATGCSTYDGLYPNSNSTISSNTGNIQYKNTNYIVFRTWDNDPRCGIRNNKVIDEPYLQKNISMEDFGPVQVPEDNYFFMGDNRNHSSDSREWGYVKHSQIKGKVISIIWPLERAGKIK